MTGRFVLMMMALTALATAQAEEPKWLTEARVQEGKLGAPTAIRSEDGWFSAMVPVKVSGKITEDSGAYSMTFPLAPDEDASCIVYKSAHDDAQYLSAVAKSVFSDVVEKSQGKIEAKAVEFSEAGAIQHNPYLAIRWIYRVNDGKSARVGGYKQFITEKQGHTISCSHISIGFVRTFREAVQALVESIAFKDKESPAVPFYSELSIVRLGSTPLGYSALTLQRDADGDVKASMLFSALIQRAPGELVARDSSSVEWTHADGGLINATHYVSAGGETEADLALEHDKDHWHLSGSFHGKKLDAPVADPPLVNTWLRQANWMRSAVKAKPTDPQELISYAWTESDPMHFVEQHVARLADAKPGEPNFQMSVAGVTVPLTVDIATGQASKGTIPMGGQTITMELVDSSGSF